MHKPGVRGVFEEGRHLDGDMMNGVPEVLVVGHGAEDGELEQLKIKKETSNHDLSLL